MNLRVTPNILVRFVLTLSVSLFLLSPVAGQDPPVAGQDPPAGAQEASAEALVRELYDLVTWPPGTLPDWDQLKALFLPETVIVLRTTRTATQVLSLDGFVQLWLRDVEGYNLGETGFTERILRTHATEFGDLAHVWVLYEAEIPGSGRPPQQGVDSFQLARQAGQWRIVSITNEIPTPDHPIPEVLRGEG